MSSHKPGTSNVIMFGGGATALKLDTDDDRQSPRRRVLKAGIVAYSGRNCSVQCTVRDLSDTGARLRAAGSVNVPDTFELIIETEGFEADCEVVWRNNDELGVAFQGAPRQTKPIRKQVVDAVRPTAKRSIRRKTIKQ